MIGVIGGFTNAVALAASKPELPSINDFFASRDFVPWYSVRNESHYISSNINDDYCYAYIRH